MELFDKIKAIYPQLEVADFHPARGSILLQNDGDARGDYIAQWNHPTLQRPTDEQLAEIN